MIIQKLVPTYKCKWHPRHMNANFSNKSSDKCSSLEAFPCIYIRPSSKRLFIQICHQDIQNHTILSKVSSINTVGLISRSCVSECVRGDYSADMRCLGGAGVSGVCRDPPEKEDRGFSGGIEPFSHRWGMQAGEGWALLGWALPGVLVSIYLPLSLSATLLPRWQIMLEAEWWGSSWRSCLYHLQKGKNLRPAGGFWGG